MLKNYLQLPPAICVAFTLVTYIGGFIIKNSEISIFLVGLNTTKVANNIISLIRTFGVAGDIVIIYFVSALPRVFDMVLMAAMGSCASRAPTTCFSKNLD